MSNNLKLLTLNVQGLAEKTKRTKVFRYLRTQKCDIACLQETHSVRKKEKIWQNEWGGEIFFSHGESNARGVAILFSRKISIQNVQTERDDDGRLLYLQFVLNNERFCIVNVYAPNEDDPTFYAYMLEKVVEKQQDYTYVLGDLNVTLDAHKDKKGGGFKKLSTAAGVVNCFLEENNWIDI